LYLYNSTGHYHFSNNQVILLYIKVNFFISGYTINWYYNLADDTNSKYINPVSNLLRFHWGSIGAGSFMTGFFTIFDLIFEILEPK
jgi:hypothetical protein